MKLSPGDTDTLEHFMEWTKQDNSDYYIVAVGTCHLLKEKSNDNAKFCSEGDDGTVINSNGSMTFKNFELANGQDISYLYLFYPETNEWKVYC